MPSLSPLGRPAWPDWCSRVYTTGWPLALEPAGATNHFAECGVADFVEFRPRNRSYVPLGGPSDEPERRAAYVHY